MNWTWLPLLCYRWEWRLQVLWLLHVHGMWLQCVSSLLHLMMLRSNTKHVMCVIRGLLEVNSEIYWSCRMRSSTALNHRRIALILYCGYNEMIENSPVELTFRKNESPSWSRCSVWSKIANTCRLHLVFLLAITLMVYSLFILIRWCLVTTQNVMDAWFVILNRIILGMIGDVSSQSIDVTLAHKSNQLDNYILLLEFSVLNLIAWFLHSVQIHILMGDVSQNMEYSS